MESVAIKKNVKKKESEMTKKTKKKKKKDVLITIIRHGGSAIRFKSQPHVWTAHSLPSFKVKKTFGARLKIMK